MDADPPKPTPTKETPAQRRVTLLDTVSKPDGRATPAAPEPELGDQQFAPAPDVSGLCWPEPAAAFVDQLRARYAVDLSERAAAALSTLAPASGSLYLSRLLETLERASPVDRIAAFSTAAGSADFSAEHDEQALHSRAVALARHLIGAPGFDEFAIIVPAWLTETRALHLPHLGVAVAPCRGPVSFRCEGRHVVAVWTDGGAATWPLDRESRPASSGDPRFVILPSVNGWNVVNAARDPEFLAPEISPAADPTLTDDALALLADGAALLREVWPEAAAVNQRILDSALIQPPSGDHTTSITVGRLQGLFIASLRDPAQVADAICHEGAHARLSLCFHVDSLIIDDGEAIHPSPWRQDPRPLKGVLNGVHSFLNVCELYRRLSAAMPESRDALDAIYDEQARRLRTAWSYLSERAETTPRGAQFFDELSAGVAAL